jgi:hypothetical protein
MFVYVAKNDPRIDEYERMLKPLESYYFSYEFGPPRFMCHVLNYAFTVKWPDMKYCHEVNDDHIFKDHDWDTKMQKMIETNGGWGMVSGEGREHLPTSVMMSGNIIRTLGYVFPGEFQHHSCDLYIEDLGKACGLLLYPDKTLIEHMHFAWGKAKHDKVYEWVYSKEQQAIGLDAYEKWKATRRNEDINKIKEARKTHD